jgi:hypothetical protein
LSSSQAQVSTGAGEVRLFSPENEFSGCKSQTCWKQVSNPSPTGLSRFGFFPGAGFKRRRGDPWEEKGGSIHQNPPSARHVWAAAPVTNNQILLPKLSLNFKMLTNYFIPQKV